MLIGGRRSTRVVECLRCHRITMPGARECPHCKANLSGNSVVHRIFEQNTDDMVHASVSCPGCKRLLKTSTETCPECGTFIARAYAAQNIKDNVTVAQAYVLAQRIESFNPFVWFTLALAAGLHVAAVVVELAPFRALVLLPLIYSMLMLLPIRQWFRQFGGFESDDEEFSAARRKVKGALRLRLGVIAAQIIGLTLKWLLW